MWIIKNTDIFPLVLSAKSRYPSMRGLRFTEQTSDFDVVMLTHDFLDDSPERFIEIWIQQTQDSIRGWEESQRQKNILDSKTQSGFRLTKNSQKYHRQLQSYLVEVDRRLLAIVTAKRILRYRRYQWFNLPAEIQTLILDKVPLRDIILNVSQVNKHFYYQVYADVGLLSQAKYACTIPKTLDVWEIPRIQEYIRKINNHFPETLVVVVEGNTLRVSLNRSWFIQRVLDTRQRSCRCRDHKYLYRYTWTLSFQNFRKWISQESQDLNEFMTELRSQLRKRSKLDALQNYLQAGEFGKIPNRNLRDFYRETAKSINYYFTGLDISLDWVAARREVMSECFDKVKDYLSRFDLIYNPKGSFRNIPATLSQIREFLGTVQFIPLGDDPYWRLDFSKFKDGVERISVALTEFNGDLRALGIILQASQRLLIAYAEFLNSVYISAEWHRVRKFEERFPDPYEGVNFAYSDEIDHYAEAEDCLYPNCLSKAKKLSLRYQDCFYLELTEDVLEREDSDDDYW